MKRKPSRKRWPRGVPRPLFPGLIIGSFNTPGLEKWRPRRAATIIDWLQLVERLISLHSTLITRGKYKGHGECRVASWVGALGVIVDRYIRATRRGKAYDGNMAVASTMGLVLAAWYAQVHRAKAYDGNRPLRNRRAALRQRQRFMAMLAECTSSEAIMSRVWAAQKFEPPFGKGAKGGKFI